MFYLEYLHNCFVIHITVHEESKNTTENLGSDVHKEFLYISEITFHKHHSGYSGVEVTSTEVTTEVDSGKKTDSNRYGTLISENDREEHESTNEFNNEF
jgi:hypothetical protein